MISSKDNMVIPIHDSDYDVVCQRCIKDLVRNANSKEYCNERGFRQKYIDLLFQLGYYKDNESIFINKEF